MANNITSSSFLSLVIMSPVNVNRENELKEHKDKTEADDAGRISILSKECFPTFISNIEELEKSKYLPETGDGIICLNHFSKLKKGSGLSPLTESQVKVFEESSKADERAAKYLGPCGKCILVSIPILCCIFAAPKLVVGTMCCLPPAVQACVTSGVAPDWISACSGVVGGSASNLAGLRFTGTNTDTSSTLKDYKFRKIGNIQARITEAAFLLRKLYDSSDEKQQNLAKILAKNIDFREVKQRIKENIYKDEMRDFAQLDAKFKANKLSTKDCLFHQVLGSIVNDEFDQDTGLKLLEDAINSIRTEQMPTTRELKREAVIDRERVNFQAERTRDRQRIEALELSLGKLTAKITS